QNTDHWRVGCDGGLYETWNAAGDWMYYPNLPVTQFYKVAVDNDEPFYNVYGGTQDNNTQGGPSRTTSSHGIMNSDWFITNGGDGFEPQIDPSNPDIVYGQAQYGWLVRYDKQSGERVAIQPQPTADDEAFRWNWDAPLLISPHDPKRLYFAANVVFKSEDRGNSWDRISEDLTQQIDRNELKVMGRVWEPEAVMKNMSTSIYGNIVALDESPLIEGLLYIGTDDGIVQVSEDGGENWTKISSFPGVPVNTYVNSIVASKHDENTVYAAFNNHKNGDFKPYVLRSTNRGKSWESIAANLPERGSVYTLAQDHKDRELLFAGTEFGCFFSNDAGANWTQLKAGIPTIAVRDIAIQERESDLVLATFGRGFYILDDYSPLRSYDEELAEKSAHIFPIKDALLYIESNRLGGKGKSSSGESLFTSENPPYGAVFTYFLGDTLRTDKEKRLKRARMDIKAGDDGVYPDVEKLRDESREDDPFLLFLVKDSDGNIVRKIKEPASAGVHRTAWNLRHTSTSPVKLKETEPGRYSSPDEGMLALPGTYTVELLKNQKGTFTQMVEPVSFRVEPLNNQTLLAGDKEEVLAFQKSVAELHRSLKGTQKLHNESSEKINYIESAILKFPGAPLEMMEEVQALEDELYELKLEIWGDDIKSDLQMETLPGISGRLSYASYSSWWNTAAPTQTAREQYTIAQKEYSDVLARSKAVADALRAMEKKLVELKVPYTPGRGAAWGEE
ncbi:MAG TPA: hypothetical protein VJ911_08775, partial [Cryomorphaceae bacterium]|nr:hypothetical protein [Cryomorphaceae bacterium]